MSDKGINETRHDTLLDGLRRIVALQKQGGELQERRGEIRAELKKELDIELHALDTGIKLARDCEANGVDYETKWRGTFEESFTAEQARIKEENADKDQPELFDQGGDDD